MFYRFVIRYSNKVKGIKNSCHEQEDNSFQRLAKSEAALQSCT